MLVMLSVLHTATKIFHTNWEPSSVCNSDEIPKLVITTSKAIQGPAVVFCFFSGMFLVDVMYRSVIATTNGPPYIVSRRNPKMFIQT